MAKWIYSFGDGEAEGHSGLRNLLGGKGANLAEMSNFGLPVPPGFTITTEVCSWYYGHARAYPPELKREVEVALARVGALTGRVFDDAVNPLLVSVRSGARASMPGMMDTVLNLGMNDRTVEAVAAASDDRRFAYDSPTAASSRCIRTSFSRSIIIVSRNCSTAPRRRRGIPSTPIFRPTTGSKSSKPTSP